VVSFVYVFYVNRKAVEYLPRLRRINIKATDMSYPQLLFKFILSFLTVKYTKNHSRKNGYDITANRKI
ncbi:hypothetical protein ACFLTB_02600, partial [Chloroflexota bacterium]